MSANTQKRRAKILALARKTEESRVNAVDLVRALTFLAECARLFVDEPGELGEEPERRDLEEVLTFLEDEHAREARE